MKRGAIKSWQYAILALGVSVCLIGAFLMWNGSILGQNITTIAAVMGIAGIGIIGIFQTTLALGAREG